ncbi:MAG: hypothetical protein JJP05_08740 [cyanobacterium endosymbiont of Rhopalodia gibba]
MTILLVMTSIRNYAYELVGLLKETVLSLYCLYSKMGLASVSFLKSLLK